MDSAKIRQCESCNAALTDGYCEMTLALTGERKRLCWECARDELKVQRALHADDLLAAGMMEHFS